MSAWGDKPNPGSGEAIALGCRCPILDNRHGKGLDYPNGPAFWVNADCPLHGMKSQSPPMNLHGEEATDESA